MHIGYGYLMYFVDPINCFCLMIAVGQIYDYHDPRSLIPLSLFATLSMINHVYAMSLKLRQQNMINHRLIEDDSDQMVPQMQLTRGDLIELDPLDEIPADLLLLGTDQSALVQELELTGEDIVVSKVGLEFDWQSQLTLDDTITIHHHHQQGSITVGGQVRPYTAKHMLFRGQVGGW